MGFLQSSALVLLVAVILVTIPGWLKPTVKVPPVVGSVQPGWEHVMDVYRQLFADGDDRGSSLCIYHKGKPVVDLRGGFANEKELWPWQENTITRLFSCTKGLAAIVIGVLADRGLLKYNDLVVQHWPEFGVHGKENITVEMLLSHQAGLVTISDETFSIWDEIDDIEKVGRLLAAERPKWKIGTGIGYHAMTIGMYMDQLVRHIDPQHRNIAQFFHEEIAEPFDLDIQFGLQEYDVYRATDLEMWPFRIKYLGIPEVRTFLKAYLFGWIWDEEPNDMCNNSQTFDDPEISPIWIRMRPDVNRLQNPSAFGHANAHSLAKLFGILANGGSLDGKELMSPETVKLQSQVISSGRDKCFKLNMTYGRGYTILHSPKNTPMFGSPGKGGQMGYADPENKLGIGFTSNYLSMTGLKDHRYVFLEKAIYKALDEMEIKSRKAKSRTVQLENQT